MLLAILYNLGYFPYVSILDLRRITSLLSELMRIDRSHRLYYNTRLAELTNSRPSQARAG